MIIYILVGATQNCHIYTEKRRNVVFVSETNILYIFYWLTTFTKTKLRNKTSNKPRNGRTPITSSLLNKHFIFA